MFMYRGLIIGGLAVLLWNSIPPAPALPTVVAAPPAIIQLPPDQTALLALQEQNRLLRSQVTDLQTQLAKAQEMWAADLQKQSAEFDKRTELITALRRENELLRGGSSNCGPSQPAVMVQGYSRPGIFGGRFRGRRGR